MHSKSWIISLSKHWFELNSTKPKSCMSAPTQQGAWDKYLSRRDERKAHKLFIYHLSDYFIWESLIGCLWWTFPNLQARYGCIHSGLGLVCLHIGYWGLRATTV